MISKDEVKKLASLSRLSLTEDEMERFQGEIDAILGFVDKVKTASEAVAKIEHTHNNVFRDDVVTHTSGGYTDVLVESAPQSENGYVKVKKILE